MNLGARVQRLDSGRLKTCQGHAQSTNERSGSTIGIRVLIDEEIKQVAIVEDKSL